MNALLGNMGAATPPMSGHNGTSLPITGSLYGRSFYGGTPVSQSGPLANFPWLAQMLQPQGVSALPHPQQQALGSLSQLTPQQLTMLQSLLAQPK